MQVEVKRAGNLENHFCCPNVWKISNMEVRLKYELSELKTEVFIEEFENKILIAFTFKDTSKIVLKDSEKFFSISVDENGRIQYALTDRTNISKVIEYLNSILRNLSVYDLNKFELMTLIKKDFILRQVEIIYEILKTYCCNSSVSSSELLTV